MNGYETIITFLVVESVIAWGIIYCLFKEISDLTKRNPIERQWGGM